MNFLSYLGSLLGAFLRSLFGKSDQERLGAAEERVSEYQRRDSVKRAMDDAPKISEKSELIDKLKNGSLAIFLAFFLCSCAAAPTALCQKVKEWTRAQQAQMASDIQKLPETSPLVAAMIDYHNMRQEARACVSLGE